MELKEVYKVSRVNEALEILETYKGNAKVLAGGTDLVIEIKERKLKKEVLVDLSSVDELKFIREDSEFIEIGAGTTFTEISNNEIIRQKAKGLSHAAKSVGSPQIRNRGTVGGNICNGSPAADTVPPLLALGATCLIKSKDSYREVNLRDIYLGKGQVDLKDNEILYSVKFKTPLDNQYVGFSKLGLRNALAIARISCAIFIEVDEDDYCRGIRIGSGAISTTPNREFELEKVLINRKVDESFMEKACSFFEIIVKERLKGRSSMEFKKEAIKGIFKEALNNALKDRK